MDGVCAVMARYAFASPVVLYGPSALYDGAEGWLLAVLREGSLPRPSGGSLFPHPCDVLPFRAVEASGYRFPAVSRPFFRGMDLVGCSIAARRAGVSAGVVESLSRGLGGLRNAARVFKTMTVSKDGRITMDVSKGKAKGFNIRLNVFLPFEMYVFALVDEDRLEEAIALFEKAREFGFGIKTNVGWGAFRECNVEYGPVTEHVDLDGAALEPETFTVRADGCRLALRPMPLEWCAEQGVRVDCAFYRKPYPPHSATPGVYVAMGLSDLNGVVDSLIGKFGLGRGFFEEEAPVYDESDWQF